MHTAINDALINQMPNSFLNQLAGVQKSQISKLESSANSATIDTVLKVFKALKADIHFNVTLEKQYLQLV